MLVLISIMILLPAILTIFSSQYVSATNSTNNGNASLSVFDDADSYERYTYCSEYCVQKNKYESDWNTYFFANFTNQTSGAVISNGNCSIRFNETGSYGAWQNMTYNGTSYFYGYNRSFTRDGNFTWQVNCNATSYGELNASDNFFITNTVPYIKGKSPEGKLATWNIYEDTAYTYNFSINVSEDDANDLTILAYNYTTANTTLTNFTLNSSASTLTANITHNNYTGSKQIVWSVKDDGSISDEATLPVNITAVNDAPQFVRIPNNVTEGQILNFTISATDEEDNVPFYFNFTVISCNKTYAPDDGCNVFNLTAINSTSTSFTFNISINNSIATNDEVGNYTINFSVRDSGNTSQPYNTSTTQTVNFTVINTNDLPYFIYACNNEINATEDSLFSCYINATDVDESYNLTFFSNYSWLKFNNSQSSITVNVSDNSAQALINFTPIDAQVGNWTINITVRDSGEGTPSDMKSNYTSKYLFVNNTPDTLSLSAIQNQIAYPNIQFILYVNATDDDLLIPTQGRQIYNESLNFSDNSSLFNITKYSESYSGASNISIALIQFTPTNDDVGNSTINISVKDNSNNADYEIFVLSVENNTAPQWLSNTPTNQSLTEDTLYYFNLSAWVTDADNDSIIFYSNNSFSEFPSFNLNQATGILNFTPNDSDVGLHYIKINASDGPTKGNSSKIFAFNVSNVYDNPSINQTQNMTTTEENVTVIYLYAYDDDLFVQDKGVYNETLTFAKNITNLTGVYRDLFNVSVVSTNGNLTTALINFTPVKADKGNYSINITITDIQGLSDYMVFNLIILELNHTPQFTVSNQTAGVNNTFMLYVNATDADNDSIVFSDNATFFNITKINETHDNNITLATALINFTPNDSYIGLYYVKINASDGVNINSSNVMFSIYDPPVIYSLVCLPLSPSENDTTTCFGNASQTIDENLTYYWIVDDAIRANDSGSDMQTWDYDTNFTDEGLRNLTLNVSNGFFTTSDSISMNVTHANAPPEFSGQIPALTVTGTSTNLELLDYFSDVDHDDLDYNQTINFSWVHYNLSLTELATPTITTTLSNYTATFSSSASAIEYLKFTAIDSDNISYNISSNYFIVNITSAPPTVTRGGGGTKPLDISLEIIVPDPFSMDALGITTVPITFYNNGVAALNGIKIGLATTRNDVKLELSEYEISSLAIGQKKELELTIIANAFSVRDIEPMEIIITGNVSSPVLTESATLLVNLLEHDRELRIKAEQKSLFLQELMERNKECSELNEVLKEANEEFNQANYSNALNMSESAIQVCKSILESKGKNIFIPKRLEDYKWLIILIIIIAAVVIFILSLLSYYYQKRKAYNK